MTKRFFAFGCSFTDYVMMTWADIVGYALHQQGYEYYNFGVMGIGNNGILSNMVLANSIHKFTDDDIIMVVWTGWNREDRLEPVGDDRVTWLAGGSIHNNPYYDEDFIRKYWSIENDVMNNLVSILCAKQMFNITFSDTYGINSEINTTFVQKYDYQSDSLFDIMVNKDYDHDHEFKYKFGVDEGITSPFYDLDGHPSLEQHLYFVEHHIQPQINIDLKLENVKPWVMNIFELQKQCLFTGDKDHIMGLIGKVSYNAIHQYQKDNVINYLFETPNVILDFLLREYHKL